MSPSERCDEILKLIDETLDECEYAGAASGDHPSSNGTGDDRGDRAAA